MNMHKQFKHIQLSLKAQNTLFEAQLKRSKSAMMCNISSGLVLFIALIALNVSIFCHLSGESVWRDAALSLAVLNVALAIIPYVISKRFQQPTKEEILVKEIRDMSLSAVGEQTKQDVGTLPGLNLLNAATQGHGTFAALLPIFQMAFNELNKRRKE